MSAAETTRLASMEILSNGLGGVESFFLLLSYRLPSFVHVAEVW